MLTKTERFEKTLKRQRLRITSRVHNAAPAYIFGVGRSGTDMTTWVFNRSPNAECYYDHDLEAFERNVLRVGAVENLLPKSRAQVVLFKCILNSQTARALLDLDARARAIWLFRPYADVVNSNLRRFRGHFQDLVDMLEDPQRAAWRLENVTPDDMSLVRKFHDKKVSDASARALLWVLRNRLLFQQQLETDRRMFVVNYDRIVTRPVKTFGLMFEHLDLLFSPKYVRKVHANSVQKEPHPELDPEIAQMCDAMLEQLNNVGDQWLSA